MVNEKDSRQACIKVALAVVFPLSEHCSQRPSVEAGCDRREPIVQTRQGRRCILVQFCAPFWVPGHNLHVSHCFGRRVETGVDKSLLDKKVEKGRDALCVGSASGQGHFEKQLSSAEVSEPRQRQISTPR